ncbi:MAG: hypothetical protein KAY24_17495 [Candidatus Eisenbacteria sp.]|nr:hypothetical protein [Candidatus Eisenbacteria bacterium]
MKKRQQPTAAAGARGGRNQTGAIWKRSASTFQVGLALLIAAALAPWAAVASGDTADFQSMAGNTTAAVVAGSGGAIYYSSGSHVTFQPSSVENLEVDLWGAAENGSGRFFVVGDEGTILISSGAHGAAFIAEASPTNYALYCVVAFASCMVAAGDGGTLVRSTSLLGGGWTSQSTGTQKTLYDLAQGNSVAVAVGEGGTILKGSIHGTGWTPVPDAPAPGAELRGITVLGDQRFLAVGLGGTVIRGLADGLSWEVLTFPPECDLYDVAARPGAQALVVAVGEGGMVFTSSDAGETWEPADSPVNRTLRSVVYTGNDFLAAGDHGTLLRSLYGIVWDDLTPIRKTSWGKLKGLFR